MVFDSLTNYKKIKLSHIQIKMKFNPNPTRLDQNWPTDLLVELNFPPSFLKWYLFLYYKQKKNPNPISWTNFGIYRGILQSFIFLHRL